jgi:hypothetical protein
MHGPYSVIKSRSIRPFLATCISHIPGTPSQSFHHLADPGLAMSIQQRAIPLIAGTMSIVMKRPGVNLPQTHPRNFPIFTRSRLGSTTTEAASLPRAHARTFSYTNSRYAITTTSIAFIASHSR